MKHYNSRKYPFKNIGCVKYVECLTECFFRVVHLECHTFANSLGIWGHQSTTENSVYAANVLYINSNVTLSVC